LFFLRKLAYVVKGDPSGSVVNGRYYSAALGWLVGLAHWAAARRTAVSRAEWEKGETGETENGTEQKQHSRDKRKLFLVYVSG